MVDNLKDAMKQYYERFHEPYSTFIGQHKTEDEMLEEINRCLEADTPQEEPVYEEGKIY